MIYKRVAEERGHAVRSWLTSWHSFSFSSYYDPQFMGFGPLRVINDDVIAPMSGFATHPHENMEILTYVLQGTVTHKDSMGNELQITAGEFQIMSAGTGITHSEMNADPSVPLHLYQIWIEPNEMNITPRYEQRNFGDQVGQQTLLSPTGEQGFKVHQDMWLHRFIFNENTSHEYQINPQRKVWIQVIRGDIEVNGVTLSEADAVAIWQESIASIKATDNSEILLFDLPE